MKIRIKIFFRVHLTGDLRLNSKDYILGFRILFLTNGLRIACVYCGKLLYPQKANWISYNPLITYPIQQNIPNISLSFNPNTNRISIPRIPVCDSCNKPSTRFFFPHLSLIPEVIKSVPYIKENICPRFTYIVL
ncbi:hypothetical protein RhiirA4_3858 [Rhizophagus irregularis]|uniref:Uncharacterized protein n=1 Tax=Rhizophagus irregularis TaxID=588596 RepID=A0A2I1G1G2_9GLOM|nr:hypothetical protein RhiirA4_3858 [Rhizophagus irregularis]